MALLDYLSMPPSHPRRWLGPAIPAPLPLPTPVTGPTTPPFLPTAGPLPVPEQGEVRVGTPVDENTSRLGRLMAERSTLGSADVSSAVKSTPWGYEVQPPEQSPSRVKQALLGVLHGANQAAQATGGDPWATLGGAATGAAAGGISPRLMQALTRKQEMDRVTGDVVTEQTIQARNAAIAADIAQPELRALQIQRQIDQDAAMNADRDADRAIRAQNATTRSQQAQTANELRGKTLEETMRHNKAMEGKTAATEEITVAGRKFKVSPNTAANILERRTAAITKPDKEREESSIEVDLETEAANDHLSKRKEADEQASTLRKEREDLTKGVGLVKNKARIAEIDRQIAQAEKEASYRQKEADDAFARARKAGAKAAAKPAGGGRTIEGAVEAFKKAKGRAPTADEIERMKAALER